MVIRDVYLPAVGVEKNICDVEVPAVKMRNNMSPTAKKRKLIDEENKENKNFRMTSKVIYNHEYHSRNKDENRKSLRGQLSSQITSTIPENKFSIEIEDESKPAFTVGGGF